MIAMTTLPDEHAAHDRDVVTNVGITEQQEAAWVEVGEDMAQEGRADVDR